MTTISHNRRPGRPRARAFIMVIVLALCVAALVLLRTQEGSLWWRVVAPVVAFRDSLDATQNAQLLAELASTTAALADRNALYQENISLKAQFGRDTTLH